MTHHCRFCKVELTPENSYQRQIECKKCSELRIILLTFYKKVQQQGVPWAENFIKKSRQRLDLYERIIQGAEYKELVSIVRVK